MDLTQHIEKIPLFQGLPEEQIADIVRIAASRRLERGETIFSEGAEGAGFYVVISGRVKVFKLSPEGKEQILHLFGPGEPFGEVAVFAGQRFPAHAEAVQKSKLLFFSRAAILNLIAENPSLALNMLAVLSRRLRKFTDLIEGLSLKEVPGRLAAHLLLLSRNLGDAEELTLDISKGQLAGLLGTIPETLSRILARMAGQGYIELKGTRGIGLLDKEGLEDLASGSRRLL